MTRVGEQGGQARPQRGSLDLAAPPKGKGPGVPRRAARPELSYIPAAWQQFQLHSARCESEALPSTDSTDGKVLL